MDPDRRGGVRMTRTHALCAAILASALAATTGCTLFREAEGTTPPPSAPTAVSVPSPSIPGASATPTTPAPTPTPTTSDAVTKTIYRYYEVLDDLGQKPPKSPYKKLLTITRGEAFEMWQNVVVQDAASGRRQLGSVKVLSVSQGKKSKKDGRQRVEVVTCIDVSEVDLVDKKGKSVVPKDRPDKAASKLLLERNDNIWYIIRDRDDSKKC